MLTTDTARRVMPSRHNTDNSGKAAQSKMSSTKRPSTKSRQNSTELPFHHFAYKNDIPGLKASLSNNKTDICARDLRGRTALFVATCYNRVEIARMLLAMGCDPNTADHEGNTPLHEATEKSSLEMVQLLIKSGKCKVDCRNHDGQTSLMKAAFYDYHNILKYLLQKGANANAIDSKGRPALHFALQEGNEQAASCLMKHGSDVNIVDSDGHSALYVAIHSNYFHASDCLLLMETSGYNFKKDAGWLAAEERSSKFYKLDDVYVRFLNLAGVSRKSKDSPVMLRANNDQWRVPYTLVLGKNNHVTSPRPARAVKNIGKCGR